MCKYENFITYCSKVMANVIGPFFANKQTDRQTGQKLYAPRPLSINVLALREVVLTLMFFLNCFSLCTILYYFVLSFVCNSFSTYQNRLYSIELKINK